MTFKRFEQLFKTKYPEGEVFMHGEFALTEKNGKVAVVFNSANPKVYEYYGSYQDILLRVGVKVLYKKDIESAEKRLQQLKEEHGKPNKYSFFDDTPMDWSREIAEYEKYLEDAKNGGYIII